MNMKKRYICIFISMLVMLLAGCGKSATEKDRTVSGSAVSEGAATVEPVSRPAVQGVDSKGETTELHQKSCEMTEQIVAGLFEPVIANMTLEFAAQTTEEQLKQSWQGETENLTGYQGIENVVETVGEKSEKVFVTLRYENNEGIKIKFEYNNEKLLEELWFERISLPPLGETSGSYEEKEFTVGRKPYELQGVLTLPDSAGKVPVVILLAGDDSSDMDGTVGLAENTPMRDIAYGLAAKGIASLRYNRRAFQYPAAVSKGAGTYDLFLQDALYAVDQIYNDRRVDREKIFLLGHGKAADYLPAVIQKKEKRIAGAVMLAGKPVAVREQYYSAKEKDISFDARYLMDDNSTMPLLILQGEADFETDLESYEEWRTVLKGRAHTEYHSYKKLNHYFITTNGKTDASDYDTAGKVSTSVIHKVAGWCKNQK